MASRPRDPRTPFPAAWALSLRSAYPSRRIEHRQISPLRHHGSDSTITRAFAGPSQSTSSLSAVPTARRPSDVGVSRVETSTTQPAPRLRSTAWAALAPSWAIESTFAEDRVRVPRPVWRGGTRGNPSGWHAGRRCDDAVPSRSSACFRARPRPARAAAPLACPRANPRRDPRGRAHS
jgi:hypothetical protein